MWYNINKIKERSVQIVGWEIIKTPVEEMFRLEELYNEKTDYIYLTEEEIEEVEKIVKNFKDDFDNSGNI